MKYSNSGIKTGCKWTCLKGQPSSCQCCPFCSSRASQKVSWYWKQMPHPVISLACLSQTATAPSETQTQKSVDQIGLGRGVGGVCKSDPPSSTQPKTLAFGQESCFYYLNIFEDILFTTRCKLKQDYCESLEEGAHVEAGFLRKALPQETRVPLS